MSPARERGRAGEGWVWGVLAAVAVAAAGGIASALAGIPREAGLEARARALARELSCPVCEGQSVAESSSTVAAQMRAEILRMLSEGRSEDEIIDHYVRQYGPWILASPPAGGPYVLLWGAPLLVLGPGAFWAYRRLMGRGARGAGGDGQG